MKDLPREDHHWPTRYAKMIFKGGLIGSVFGYIHFIGGNTGQFEMNKLMAASGTRNWSGRSYRLLKNVLGPYAMYGAGVFLTYDIVHYFLRHHDEANSRSQFGDHVIASTIIGTGLSLLYFSHP